jgi:hypothetical protein
MESSLCSDIPYRNVQELARIYRQKNKSSISDFPLNVKKTKLCEKLGIPLKRPEVFSVNPFLFDILSILVEQLETVERMRKDYCEKTLSEKDITKLDTLLEGFRITVVGKKRDKETWSFRGVTWYMDNIPEVKTREKYDLYIKALYSIKKRAFKIFTNITEFIVLHCRLKTGGGRLIPLPSINIGFDVNETKSFSCNGQQVPEDMKAWLNVREDGWKDKNVLCNVMYLGNQVLFSPGQILENRFEVVSVAEKWVAIGRKDKQNTRTPAKPWWKRLLSIAIRYANSTLSWVWYVLKSLVTLLINSLNVVYDTGKFIWKEIYTKWNIIFWIGIVLSLLFVYAGTGGFLQTIMKDIFKDYLYPFFNRLLYLARTPINILTRSVGLTLFKYHGVKFSKPASMKFASALQMLARGLILQAPEAAALVSSGAESSNENQLGGKLENLLATEISQGKLVSTIKDSRNASMALVEYVSRKKKTDTSLNKLLNDYFASQSFLAGLVDIGGGSSLDKVSENVSYEIEPLVSMFSNWFSNVFVGVSGAAAAGIAGAVAVGQVGGGNPVYLANIMQDFAPGGMMFNEYGAAWVADALGGVDPGHPVWAILPAGLADQFRQLLNPVLLAPIIQGIQRILNRN